MVDDPWTQRPRIMSIQWQNFNEDIVMTPAGIANEIKRITDVPEDCSVADFLGVYFVECDNTSQPWRKALLRFCISAWVLKLYTGADENRALLQNKANECWEDLCQQLEELPDIDQEDQRKP